MSETLKVLAQVAGIGGVAIGAAILVFRDIIRKNIFPRLSKEDAYRVIRLISVLVWSIAIAGIIAWVLSNDNSITNGDKSPIIDRTEGSVHLQIQ
ncbi:hypothetical protein EXN32_19755 [Agrobacterium tumefaciens]|uniref:hypothetical protein n=1 Tax=Agrobacterium TaxID=357 RepID=UPI00115F62A2|nr:MULTISPECIES: hypothetical protein [Agrobacterium]MDA5241715.1 hypothetical protein [Agrobacterium sp. MAFF310724]MDA5248898.1 hypothetical protein [Agrobacterium sp. MAFF210268]TRB14032.1 hypothetical protein EXN32_19755 [Agrobacterium tumefaciens]